MDEPGSADDTTGRQYQEPILVVATGGSSGLGLHALVTFARQSEHGIILALGCRNPDDPAVSAAFNGLEKVHKLDIFKLDLASQDSIRAFASHIMETYPQQISVLLLCAGVLCGKRSVDSTGIEETLQVNTLSQALLLQCLWTRLVQSVHHASRVVFVASSLHKKAAQQHNVSPSSIEVLLDDKHWTSISAYSISKLVQMHLFQIVVDAFSNAQDGGIRPVAISVSPGFVPRTGLVREYSWPTRLFMTYLMPLFPFTTSLQEGAKAITRGMVDQNLESSTYISPRGSEPLAAECLDVSLRSAWHDWLISKGVWMK